MTRALVINAPPSGSDGGRHVDIAQDAEAVFQNNEEVRIIPIYRDPVHDFGFFQYNPAVRACFIVF